MLPVVTPPPTPPRVAFDPPLFLQRRTAVFDLLTSLHKLPRFNGKLRSLLEVGCGVECLLLGSLVAPNDDLPLEQVTGIDIDEGLFDQTIIDSLGPGGMYVGEEGRWRKFGLTLLHGSFDSLSLQKVAHHDIIVSAEVIEHLDPTPLSNFAPVLLGQLKPKVCIVTTPNRDFNDVFSLPFSPESTSTSSSPTLSGKERDIALGEIVDPISLSRAPPPPLPPPTVYEEAWRHLSPGDVCSSNDRYWRAGVPYGMRHPDHRFEWTREEFRNWASKAAEDFGYDVAFTGVGGLGNGMSVVGSNGSVVNEALTHRCEHLKVDDGSIGDRDSNVLEKADEVWGDCSQIAIFTMREDEENENEDFINTVDWKRRLQADPDSRILISSLNPYFFPNPITQIVHHNFPYETDEVFPPSYLTIMELLEHEIANYIPNRIREQWAKSPLELLRSRSGGNKHGERDDYFPYESDSECDYSWDPEIDGDEVARRTRKKERRYEKQIRRNIENSVLAGKRVDIIEAVNVTGVNLKTLWEDSIGGKGGLRRVCRFKEEVFREVLLSGWKEMLGETVIGNKTDGDSFCKPVIDTTGVYHSGGAGEAVEDFTSTCLQRHSPLPPPLNMDHNGRMALSPSEPQPKDLPLQLQSNTKMVVKVLSTPTSRGVADLFRRGPSEQEKDMLKTWRMIKVEFNPQGPQAAIMGAMDTEEAVEKPSKHSIVHWQDEVLSQDCGMSWEDPPTQFAYMEGEVPTIWETWDIDTTTGDNTANPSPSDNMCEDNISLVSHESLPYSIDKFGTAADAGLLPWGPGFPQKIPPTKYHMELIYPLNVVDTCLSINKGTERASNSLQAEMDRFFDLYKASESTENGILQVNWKEYIQSRERVSRWMEERRMAVRNYNQDAAVLLGAGFTREEVPARKALVTWEEWLTEVGKEEQAESSGDKEVGVRIVVFKPAHRKMVQGGKDKDIQADIRPLAMGMSSTGVAAWIDSHIAPQFAGWDEFTG